MSDRILEEGDKCPCSDCNGTMHYPPVENCSCHINPPCSQCVDNQLICNECSWQEGEPIETPKSFKQGMEEAKAIMSKTPRTDADTFWSHGNTESTLASFSRQLETELTALQSERDDMKEELEEAKSHVKTNQDVIDHLVRIANSVGWQNSDASDLSEFILEVARERDEMKAQLEKKRATAKTYFDLYGVTLTQLATVTKERDDSRENFQRVQSKVNELVLGSVQNLAKLAARIVDIEQERDQWKACAEKSEQSFKNLLEYAERNICLHEETHRGGAIWEICDHCGAKWADDQGGIPNSAREFPIEIQAARSALAELERLKGEM